MTSKEQRAHFAASYSNNQSPLDYLSPREGAEYKGIHINTIRNLIACGKLPADRLGRRVIRFRRGDLDACFTEYKSGEFGKCGA